MNGLEGSEERDWPALREARERCERLYKQLHAAQEALRVENASRLGHPAPDEARPVD